MRFSQPSSVTSTRSSRRQPPKPGRYEPGLHRHHVTGDERRGRSEPHARVLVHLQADAVAEPVEEALLERLAEILRQQRLVAVLGEQLARRAVELVARGAAAHAGDRLVERPLDEPVVLDELLGRLAHAVRAGHVGVAAGLAVLGPEVDDDRLAGRDRAGAHVVTDRALPAVGDDQLVGGHVMGREHFADLLLHALARERLAVEHQHVTARIG